MPYVTLIIIKRSKSGSEKVSKEIVEVPWGTKSR
jgi:hypothetical protein